MALAGQQSHHGPGEPGDCGGLGAVALDVAEGETPAAAAGGEDVVVAVVLLDVLMPGMDGFETAANIKRLDQTKDIPIIFLTGNDLDTAFAFRGYATGAADYLTKPFDPWVLRAKVAVFLELHRTTRELRDLLARDRERLDAIEERLTAVERHLAADGRADVAELALRVAGLESAVRGVDPPGPRRDG